MTDYLHSNNQSTRELGGSLSDYKINTILSFEKIREQVWQENTERFFKEKTLLHYSKKLLKQSV
ncbi:MAG: hypothetical protein ACIPMY_03470 [Rickettsia endosymbiont of Pentastiridius leporinus]